jgi:acyl-CoA synthetase (AMP-forming)/AMP-acid ligase II
MIITGGENVSPVEIESCLSLHRRYRKSPWPDCRTNAGARSFELSSSRAPRWRPMISMHSADAWDW